MSDEKAARLAAIRAANASRRAATDSDGAVAAPPNQKCRLLRANKRQQDRNPEMKHLRTCHRRWRCGP